MFMYALAFNLVMWRVAVPLVTGEEKLRIKMNGPLVGVVLGLIVAASGSYGALPGPVTTVLGEAGSFGLDCVLVTLGGILATIPREHITIEPELIRLGVFRFVLYPAVLLLIAALLPLGALAPDIRWGLQVSLVLQGVVPPATSLMLVAKSLGRESDVRYVGSGILFTYPLSFLLIPLFLLLSVALFR
jgi:hypothetical protein